MRKCTDPYCPCQDGDPCNYEAFGDTPAHPMPPGVEKFDPDNPEHQKLERTDGVGWPD